MIIDLLPIMTFSDDNPDFSESDCRQDSEQLMIRSEAIESFAFGKISGDDLLSIVEDSGVSPDEYLDCVLDNIEFAMGRYYAPLHSGILVPFG